MPHVRIWLGVLGVGICALHASVQCVHLCCICMCAMHVCNVCICLHLCAHACAFVRGMCMLCCQLEGVSCAASRHRLPVGRCKPFGTPSCKQLGLGCGKPTPCQLCRAVRCCAHLPCMCVVSGICRHGQWQLQTGASYLNPSAGCLLASASPPARLPDARLGLGCSNLAPCKLAELWLSNMAVVINRKWTPRVDSVG